MEEDFEWDQTALVIKEEGEVKFFTYNSKEYSNGGSALKKSMPVFYNPIQEINRSLALIAYRAFQMYFLDEIQDEPIIICDSMAASGIRTLRLLMFLNSPLEIIANDINPLSLKVIRKNMELNNNINDNDKIISLLNKDATLMFNEINNSKNRVSCIDIDPFGTPNIFIEPALKSLKLGGLIGITATDTPVLFGVRSDACLRKYSVKALRSSFLKEVGLRILIYYTAIKAHPYMNYIVPQMSLSFDHYIRIFVRISKGKKGIIENLNNFGYFLWCGKCDWRDTIEHNILKIPHNCPNCSSKIKYGGPLWIGPLHNTEFIDKCIITLDVASKEQIPSKKRLLKILHLLTEEDKLPPGYYNIHKICDNLNISVPSTNSIIQKIKKHGYNTCLTHIEPRAIKTNIGIAKLKVILKELNQANKKL